MGRRQTGPNGNSQRFERFPKHIVQRVVSSRGGIALDEVAKCNRQSSVERSTQAQLHEQTIDAVRGLRDVFEHHDRVFAFERPGRSGETGEHTQVSSDDASLHSVRRSEEVLRWDSKIRLT